MSPCLKTMACLTLTIACIPVAHASNRTVMQSFQQAVQNATASGKLDGTVKFYLAGSGPHGKVLQADVVSNRKTNAFGKKDPDACDWAAQSALIALQRAAKEAGANAVINIVSYYRKNVTSDPANYECHAGATIAGVALKGDLAIVE